MDLDVLFITPGNSRGIYQDLAKDYAAIEPPTWALQQAPSCRSIEYEVDQQAKTKDAGEQLSGN